jgi:hypothetical protein
VFLSFIFYERTLIQYQKRTKTAPFHGTLAAGRSSYFLPSRVEVVLRFAVIIISSSRFPSQQQEQSQHQPQQ